MNRTPPDAANFWRARAWREALRFNAGWVVQGVLPWIAGVGIASAFAIFVVRLLGGDARSVGFAAGGVFFAGVAVSIWRSRGLWIGGDAALAELDSAGNMRGALMAACDGAGAWPPPAPDVHIPLQWDRARILREPAIALTALALGIFLPLPPSNAGDEVPTEGPAAWAQTRALIEAVREADIANPKALDEAENELNSLAESRPGEWFAPAGLEAADHLLTSFESRSRALGVAASEMLNALQAARSADPHAPPAWRENIEQARATALDRLSSSPLAADPQLMEALANLDASRMRSLTAEEWDKLRERLEAGAMACGAPDGYADPRAAPGTMAGSGGTSRGPGSEPSLLGDAGRVFEPGRHEAISNPDFQNALTGDLLGTTTMDHQPDRGRTQADGGSIAAGAKTGAVAPMNASPAEQNALRSYFQ